MSKKIKLFQTNRSLGTIEDKPSDESRTVDLVWTTGAKGLRTTRDGFQYYEELAVNQEAIDTSRMVGNPLLASHDTTNLDSIIGVIETVSIDPVRGEGRAKVRFAKDEYSERVFQKVKDGIIRNTSVGYRINEFKDVTPKGEDIPTYRAEKWTPYEISLVSIGFDANSNIRADEIIEIETEEKLNTEAELIDPSTIAPLADLTEKGRNMNEAEQKALEAAAKKAAALEEKQRQSEIRLAVRNAKLETSFADELCEQDISADQARKLVLEKLSASQPAPVQSATRVEVGTDNQAKRREALEEAMLTRVDSKNFKPTEGSREYQGKSILRAIEAIVPRYSMESDMQYAKRAMVSADLPLALANVAEKGLQKMYELQPRSSSRWTRNDTLRNYKQYSQVKTGDFASLVERAEGADFTEAEFGEAKEVVTLKDYGIIHAFTSQMLANDDLSVIQRLSVQGGVAASRLENKLAYNALKTNKAMSDAVLLYHATHGNLGTAGAISSTTIGEAYKLMRKQTSTGGLDVLNLAPKYFICGPDQEIAAKQFFATISPTESANVNIFANSMEIVVDAELTGNQWYLAADQNVIDTVVLYKLAGQESPQIESRIKFENNNLELKVAHACAAEPMEWRGIVKNAGQI